MQAVAQVATWVVNWFVNLTATWGWSSAAWNALYQGVQAAIWAGISYGVSEATRPRQQRPQGSELTLQVDADAPRMMVIGQRMVAGSLVYHCSTGGANEHLHLVYALVDHRIEGLDRVIADGREVWSTPLAHGVRTVLTTYSYSGGPRVWMTFFDGRPGQAADGDLITASGGEWTSDHVGAGVAYVHIELAWDSDILTAVPQFLFEVRGARLYDRRLDTTAGGSGAQRLSDPATWTYTANAAVALDHFLLGYKVEEEDLAFGVGLDPSEVPYADFAALADLCDEDVATGEGAAAATIKRYRAHGVIGAEVDWLSVIEALQLQMGARVVDRGGRIGLLGAEARTPVVDLTDDDWVAGEQVSFEDKRGFADLFLAIEGRYADPNNLYQPTDYERQVADEAALPEFGEAQTRTIELPFETHPRRAARLARIQLERERRQTRLAGRMMPKAWELEPGDWFTYSSVQEGITSATFEVVEIVKHEDFTATLTAQAIDPDFVAFATDEDPDLSVPPDLDPVSLLLAAPTFTVAAVELAQGSIAEPAIRFTLSTIDPGARELVIEARRWDGAALTGDSLVEVAHSEQATTVLRKGLFPALAYKVRAKARAGARESPWSDWSAPVTTTSNYSVAAAAAIAAGMGANAVMDTGFRWRGSFWTNTYTSATLTTSEITATEGGVRIYRRAVVGTPAAGVQINMGQGYGAWALPVRADQRVEASVCFAAAGLASFVCAVEWLNAAGTVVGFTPVQTVTSFTGVAWTSGPRSIQRAGGFTGTPPDGAAYAVLVPYWTTAGGAANPSCAIGLPLIRIAHTGQTELTPWTPGLEAQLGADVTGDNTAAAIAGQGGLATASWAQLGSTVRRADGTTTATDAMLVTALGIASAISGQGALATLSSLAYGSAQLTGFGALAALAFTTLGTNVRLADGTTSATDALLVTSAGTAAAISGQGGLATLSFVTIGSNLRRADGSTVATEVLIVTSIGTAAAISGQGYGATASEEQVSNARVPGAQNDCPDTEFRWSSTVWTDLYAAGGTWTTAVFASSGRRFLQRSATAPGAGLQVNLGVGVAYGIPVRAGDRVECSAYVGFAAMTSCKLYVNWFNGSGAYLSSSEIAAPSAFSRGSGFATAPANAVTATPALVGVTAAGDPYLHLSEPLIRVAAPAQTALTPYSPGLRAQPLADVTAQGTAAAIAGQGALATLSEIITALLAPNAATDFDYDEPGGSTTLTIGTYQTIAEVEVTVPANATAVKLDWQLKALASRSSAAAASYCTVQLLRVTSGVETPLYATRPATMPADAGVGWAFEQGCAGFDVDQPGAGTHTYRLRATCTATSDGWQTSDARLAATVHKR